MSVAMERRPRGRGRAVRSSAVALLVLASVSAALLPGGGRASARATKQRSTAADVEVFMRLDATKPEVAAVRTAIRRSRLVRSFSYLTQVDALQIFKKLYADQPDLIASTTAAELPTSFPIRLKNAHDTKRFARQMRRLRGVDEVVNRRNDSTAKEIDQACQWRHDHPGPGDIEVFIDVGATTEQTEAVRAVIEAGPSVRDFVFLSHRAALREFRRQFANKPKLLRSTTAEQLPTSFRVDVDLGDQTTQIIDRIHQMPGVDEVVERVTRGLCRAMVGQAA